MKIKLQVGNKIIEWKDETENPLCTPEEWDAEVFDMLRRKIEQAYWLEHYRELEKVDPIKEAISKMKGSLNDLS